MYLFWLRLKLATPYPQTLATQTMTLQLLGKLHLLIHQLLLP
jgi:hypothetical protein